MKGQTLHGMAKSQSLILMNTEASSRGHPWMVMGACASLMGNLLRWGTWHPSEADISVLFMIMRAGLTWLYQTTYGARGNIAIIIVSIVTF